LNSSAGAYWKYQLSTPIESAVSSQQRVVTESSLSLGFPVAWLGVAIEPSGTVRFDGNRTGCRGCGGRGGVSPSPTGRARPVRRIVANWSRVVPVFAPNVLVTQLPDSHPSLAERDVRVQSDQMSN